jgi:hypothetical protein
MYFAYIGVCVLDLHPWVTLVPQGILTVIQTLCFETQSNCPRNVYLICTSLATNKEHIVADVFCHLVRNGPSLLSSSELEQCIHIPKTAKSNVDVQPCPKGKARDELPVVTL